MTITKKHLAIALAVIGFFVYAANFNNPLFWDDDDWIINNPYVHDFSHIGELFSQNVLGGVGLKSNYYRPFLLITFALNYVLGGTSPFGYHLTSNAIHIANGLLIFFLLLKWLEKRWVAFAVALVFLLHPLQTEAVTYISGRGDPLSLLCMLSALAFITYRPLSRVWTTVWALGLMIIGLLSRETTVLLPLLVVVSHAAFQARAGFLPSVWQGVKKAIPFFIVAGAYAFLRLTVLNFKNTLNFYDAANVYTENIFYRLFTFGRVVLEYFRLMVWPTGLHMERDMPIYTSFLQPPVFSAALILLGIIGVGIWLYRQERKNKDNVIPRAFRVWFFGWTWFFIFLAPVSGIIPINSILYEHWLYGALIGPLTIAAWVGHWLARRYIRTRPMVIGVAIILVVYLLFFAVATIQRNLAWGNPKAFYEDILKYSPTSVRINNNLGNLYNQEGDQEKALFYYRQAIASEDIFAQPHYNIGVIYMAQNNLKQAKEEFLAAIRIDPAFYFAYQNLAYVQVQEKDLRGAAQTLEQLKVIRSQDPAVYYNLAIVYATLGDTVKARSTAQEGINVARTNKEKQAFEELLTKLQ